MAPAFATLGDGPVHADSRSVAASSRRPSRSCRSGSSTSRESHRVRFSTMADFDEAAFGADLRSRASFLSSIKVSRRLDRSARQTDRSEECRGEPSHSFAGENSTLRRRSASHHPFRELYHPVVSCRRWIRMNGALTLRNGGR